MTEATDGALSPAMAFRSVPAPDDAGAETYDRYAWQAAMATADVLAALVDHLDAVDTPRPFELVCEHHEDWALLRDNEVELVSAKHRETSRGPFTTLQSFVTDGGVLHLFERWLALGKTPSCRLVTTAGLSADVATLLRSIGAGGADTDEANRNGAESDGVEQHVTPPVATDLVDRLGTEIARARRSKIKSISPIPPLSHFRPGSGDLAGFLAVLVVQHSRPSRTHVSLMAARAYALPVAERLRAGYAADAIWTVVLDVVQQRMRAAGRTSRGSLPTVLGGRDAAALESRTLSLSEILVLISVAIDQPAGFRALPEPVLTSRVAVKMRHGGCSVNAAARAEELRLQYRRFWRDALSGPQSISRQQRLENALLNTVDGATDRVHTTDEEWGPPLWREVQHRVTRLPSDDRRAEGFDQDLLLGGVAELANTCKVWFSDEFDVQSEVGALMREALR